MFTYGGEKKSQHITDFFKSWKILQTLRNPKIHTHTIFLIVKSYTDVV